jgi:hypothetical protein
MLVPMTEDEAEEFGVEGERQRYFRIDAVKTNLGIRRQEREWREFVSVAIGNAADGEGDEVGAVSVVSAGPRFHPGKTLKRHLPLQRAVVGLGAGKPIAEILARDLSEPMEKTRVRRALEGREGRPAHLRQQGHPWSPPPLCLGAGCCGCSRCARCTGVAKRRVDQPSPWPIHGRA